MRRIIVSALISGFAGIAVLLFGAMLRAGCWSRAQYDFWQHLPSQRADVYFQISDLMIKGQMLLIKRDLVEFGFDYFMRAAAFGLFLLLLFDVGAKRFNLGGSSNAKPNSDVPTEGPLSNQFMFTVVLPALFPTLFLLVVAFSMFSGGSMDAISIAILLPTSVLLTLIVSAARKKRLFPWQQRIDWSNPISGKLSKEAWAVIFLASILPAIGVLTTAVFFLADGYMDATTISILVPSLLLNAMVLAAAYKKRLFPWQEKVSVSDERMIPATGESMVCAEFKIQATMQLVIYLLAPGLACGVVALCSHYITWSTAMLWVKHNSIAPTFENYVRAAVSDMCNMLVAILVTTIIVYFSEVLLYRKKSAGELVRVAVSSGPIFCTLLMSWFLFWFLPAALPLVLNHPLPIYSERSMARELFRFCSSLSTILASMAGLAVALSGNAKVIAFVSSISKFPWCCTAPHKLGALEK